MDNDHREIAPKYIIGTGRIFTTILSTPVGVVGIYFFNPYNDDNHTDIWYKSHMSGAAANFEWDAAKQSANKAKHGVSFYDAQLAFLDPLRIIAVNNKHSATEM